MKDLIKLDDIKGIDNDELSRLAGFKVWNRNDGKIGIIEGKKENGQKCIKKEDLEVILIFEIYKYTRKLEKNKDLIEEFKSKLKKMGSIKMLNEILASFKEIESYYLEFDKTQDLNRRIEIIMIIMELLNRKKTKVIEDEIVVSGKEYKKLTKGGEIKSLRLTENYIQNELIEKYEEVFNNYLIDKVSKITFYNLSSEINKPTSNYNVDKKKYNSKLLAPYKNYFMFLEDNILKFPSNYLMEKNNFDRIKREFIEESKEVFQENIKKMKNILKNIEFNDVFVSLKLIDKKKEELDSKQKMFIEAQSYETNFFSTFIYIDEVLDFYNSKSGKLLNEYFKIHNLFKEMITFFNNFISRQDRLSINVIRNNFLKGMRGPLKCLGYDYEFEYHLLHDAYEILKSKYLQEEVGITEEKLLNVIDKILTHGEFYVNSNYYGTLLKKAIETNKPKAIRVLQGRIEEVSEKDLLNVLFDHVETSEMLLPIINCIDDMQRKTLYTAIYEGNAKLVNLLYEDKKVELISEENSIEMYLCIKGKNSKKIFEVILENLKMNYSDARVEVLKNNFLEVAALWGNKDILESNFGYLKSLSQDNLTLNNVLSYSLGNNLIDVFSSVFLEKNIDPSRFMFEFLRNGNIYWNDVSRETWEFILNGPFKNIDVNEKFEDASAYYGHENSIAGFAKEKIPFSIKNKKFLQKLVGETSSFKDAFEEVLVSLNKNDGHRARYCYKGIPLDDSEMHPLLKEVYDFEG